MIAVMSRTLLNMIFPGRFYAWGFFKNLLMYKYIKPSDGVAIDRRAWDYTEKWPIGTSMTVVQTLDPKLEKKSTLGATIHTKEFGDIEVPFVEIDFERREIEKDYPFLNPFIQAVDSKMVEIFG